MADTSYDEAMRRAVALAEQGRWQACPNPTVGAVLLRDGRIVAEGYHHAAGQPHAEIECLNDARAKGIDPRGATIVVTLEPCNHHGKTPPCSEALIEAGIARVVFGLRDPNPKAAGGLERLRDAGIDIVGPVLEQECRDLVADFLVWQTEQRPYIILKLAATLDGRISTRNRQRQQISNAASHHNVHLLRAGIGHCGGAVLIGGGTFRADNPALTARAVPADRQPLACILTSRLPQPAADFHLLRLAGSLRLHCGPCTGRKGRARLFRGPGRQRTPRLCRALQIPAAGSGLPLRPVRRRRQAGHVAAGVRSGG